MILAIELGNYEIIKLLLKHPNININTKYINEHKKDKLNQSHDYLVTKEGNPIYEIELIENTPLHMTIEKKEFDIFALLLEKEEIDVNVKYIIKKRRYDTEKIIEKTALHMIAEINDIEFLKVFIKKQNIDLNIKYIDFEEKYIKYKESKFIFDNRAYLEDEINDKKISTLNFAYEKDNKEIVKFLLKNSNIDANSTTEIYYNKHYSRKYSYQHDNLKKEKIYSKTLLQLAIEKKDIEIIKLLVLNSSIDPNIQSIDSYKLTNFFRRGSKIREWTINEEKTDKKTALNMAVEYNNIDLVKLLLSCKNINVNIESISIPRSKAKYNKTALYIAVEKNNEEIIKLLLENPLIDVNAKIKQKEHVKFKDLPCI